LEYRVCSKANYQGCFFVGFPPTVYILDFTSKDGKVFRETIIINEPPSQEAIDRAINQTIQRLNLAIDMERRNG
jgi:hypothetical protein